MADLMMSGEQKAAMRESRQSSADARKRQAEEDARLKGIEAKRTERLSRQRKGRSSLMSSAGGGSVVPGGTSAIPAEKKLG
jgi:hypothetical protein